MRYICTLLVMCLVGMIACNVMLAVNYSTEGYGLHPAIAFLTGILFAYTAYRIHQFGEHFQ